MLRRAIFALTGLFITGILALVLTAEPTYANEGRFFLRNILGGQSRCLAFSIDVEEQYQIGITCRGLVYPALPPAADHYILWASGGDLTAPANLGDLLRGKGHATLPQRFDRLFITIESVVPPQPTGPIVMEGTIQDYDFQLSPEAMAAAPTLVATSTPAPAGSEVNATTPTPTEVDAPSFWSTGFGKIIIIVTAGFLIFIFIVIVYSRRV